MKKILQMISLFFLHGIVSAYGEPIKLPEFRKERETEELIINAFIDVSSAQSGRNKNSSDMHAIVNAYIAEIFSTGNIKGYAFKQDGKPVGIIIEDALYKEGEELPIQSVPEFGDVRVKITTIRPSYVTLSYSPKKTKSSNATYQEITFQLPDLK